MILARTSARSVAAAVPPLRTRFPVGPSALSRSLASHSASSPQFQVFNRRTKWMQKERAARDVELSRQADYLKDEVAIRLCERLLVR